MVEGPKEISPKEKVTVVIPKNTQSKYPYQPNSKPRFPSLVLFDCIFTSMPLDKSMFSY